MAIVLLVILLSAFTVQYDISAFTLQAFYEVDFKRFTKETNTKSIYFSEADFLDYTVKKAVELLDAPSKNTFLKWNKYDSIVEIIYLYTHVFFSPLCNRMRKFDIREVQ